MHLETRKVVQGEVLDCNSKTIVEGLPSPIPRQNSWKQVTRVPFCPKEKEMQDFWSFIQPSTFKIHGENYFKDKKKTYAPNCAAFCPFGINVFVCPRKIDSGITCVIREYTELIVEGSILCCTQMKSSKFSQFWKASGNKEELSKFRLKLISVYTHMNAQMCICLCNVNAHRKPQLSQGYPEHVIGIAVGSHDFCLCFCVQFEKMYLGECQISVSNSLWEQLLEDLQVQILVWLPLNCVQRYNIIN